ncbi:hypothetical protein OK016_14980 [Vibrio chagasii]|nr:hypothetical protein [Vibrio chagasii]
MQASRVPSPFAASCPEILNGKQRLLNSAEEITCAMSLKRRNSVVVNTASQCGFLRSLSDSNNFIKPTKDQDFTVIGFPSNDFRPRQRK